MSFSRILTSELNRIAECTSRITLLWLAFVVCIAAGCGKGGPETAPVKGRVTLDGRPLESVDIVFQPNSGAPPSTSRTDADGYYEMLYKRGVMGALTGEHTVRIEFTSNIVANPPNIPPRYNKQSELKEEVKPGQNEFNFDLTTEGK